MDVSELSNVWFPAIVNSPEELTEFYMYFSALSNVWFPAIVNSPEELTEFNMYFSVLSNVWFPAIVNSPEELAEMVNFTREHPAMCLGLLTGGSTNSTMPRNGHAINISKYIPNSSGKLS